ncbi:hypothetical protein QJU89_03760 [Pasteurella skyensis]|uniref:Uncharacterized protein n=1 Tax=Phocoenobacter skyensis TaxID=97481 RepID=A0AAJ6N8E4_9PAST|nr:hypothetical protein [Pasteurella skyensis]MDP8161952.1 hypothetical protein [Pasteurella skyensis]MDP8170272.1 hypothetical protein [Pasteurella skyensis]MDP8172108.1 hypothetical protein [Pasteurella skyensis]MDP8176544.1 hypothetical protein [Pasteurella skyensis]MDP8178432.1 hypothetical protein [Pasteurella skyensis]
MANLTIKQQDELHQNISQALASFMILSQHFEDNGNKFIMSGEITRNALWNIQTLLENADKIIEGEITRGLNND